MKSLKILFLAVTLFLSAVTASAAPLNSGVTKDALYISQSTLPSGQVSIIAKQGPLTNSAAGFGIDAMGATLPQNAIPVSLPFINLGTGHATTTGLPTKGTATTLANKKVKEQMPVLQANLSSYLKQYGLSSVWFNFKQEVKLDVGGTAQTWILYWDYFTDAEGRGTYGDVQVVTTDPRILYVTYNPVAIDDTLPAGWTYPDAGRLSYQLRNMQWQAVTDFVTVNVGGVYDTPATDTDETLDSGIACMMDNSPAHCPKGYPTVKDLLDSTGAVLAVVDYRRRVQPVYKENPDGTESPVMTVSIDSRQVQYAGCGDVNYRNVGRYGFELDISVGRYLALSYGEPRVVTYNLVQTFEGKQISPTSYYDYTLKMSRATAKGIAPYSIDPLKGQALYLTTDIPGVQYVAPLSISGEISYELGTFVGETYTQADGSLESKVMMVGRCSEVGGYEVRTTLMQNWKRNGWTYYPETVNSVNNYSWTPVGLYGHGAARYIAYADEAAGILRVQDYSMSECYEVYCSWKYGRAHNYWSLMKDGPAINAYPSSIIDLILGSTSSYYSRFEKNQTNDVYFRCGSTTPWSYTTVTFNGWYSYNTVVHGPYTHQYCRGTYYFRGFNLNARAPYYELQTDVYPYSGLINPNTDGSIWYDGGWFKTTCSSGEYGWGYSCAVAPYTPCYSNCDFQGGS